MELIDRQAAIDEIENYEATAPDYMQGWAVKLIEAIKGDIRGLISELPSAHPEPKTGKWIERNPQNSPNCRLIECSECGNAYIVGYNIDYDYWIDGRNFCTKCGADMRGEEV